MNTMLAARHPEMEPANIIRDNLANLGDEVISQLPQRPALKRTINRKRQADLPRNPLSLNDIRELPDEYQKTSGGKSDKIFIIWENVIKSAVLQLSFPQTTVIKALKV